MAKLDYPVTLTVKDWDKKKPLIAKTKATGIGATLKTLQKQHDSVPWREYDFKSAGSIASLDTQYSEATKSYASKLKANIKNAEETSKLARTWEGKYSKDKLVPKSATKAAKDVADAADAYIKSINDFEAVIKKEYDDERNGILAKTRSVLKPVLTSGIKKVDLLLSDINTLKGSPTKTNLLALATGDGGARGYCTQCKNWDQLLKDFPELREKVFKGKAMDKFFPALKEYGANHSPSKWDEMLQELVKKKGISEDEAVEVHAKYLVKQIPDIKTFKGYLEAVVEELK